MFLYQIKMNKRRLNNILYLVHHHKRFIAYMILATLLLLVVVQVFFTQLGQSLTIPADYIKTESITFDQEYEFESLINPGNLIQYYDRNSNVLKTTEFNLMNRYQNQPYVSNGYIGSRIPNLGHGFTYDQWDEDTVNDLNGWPLFNKRYSGAFVAGFFDLQEKVNQTNFPELYANGYESIISAIPQWTTLYLSVEINGEKHILDPKIKQSKISNYSQSMSLNNGIVTTEYIWLDFLKIKYEVIAHRKFESIGVVKLTVMNLKDESITIDIQDTLDFATSQRCHLQEINHDQSGIFMVVNPLNQPHVNATIYSKLRAPGLKHTNYGFNSISQSFSYLLKSKSSLETSKIVNIVSSDLHEDTLKFATKLTIDESDIFESHIAAWESLKSFDIDFPRNELLTLASRASLFHLMANTRPNATSLTGALGVTGLSSDSYGGMVFWDSDLWIFGGLLPFAPENAKSIVNYRTHTHDQAIKNAHSSNGAVYPWTSGRYGNCTSTGPCMDYEYHINVAIAMAAWQSYIAGSYDDQYLKDIVYPLVNDAARFLGNEVAQYDPQLNKYVTKNLTDPDEFANHVNNGAYTNAGIQQIIELSKLISSHLKYDHDPKLDDILLKGMYIPTSNNTDNITLEFSDMPASINVKQADVVMISYPLNDDIIGKEQAITNLNYYSKKQSSTGPAMTFPIYSLVSSKLLDSGCASQSYFMKSVEPYLRGPFAQFSEQNNDDYSTNGGTHPAFPFLTAHGGMLQSIVNGFLGLRFKYNIKDGQIKRVLQLDPVAIPCLGGNLKINGIKYMGQSLDFDLVDDYLTVKHLGPLDGFEEKSVQIEIGSRNANSGVHYLHANQELTFNLYKPQANIPASISECQNATISSITQGVFGDIALMMNDGDNQTHWQALSKTDNSKIVVNLKKVQKITKGLINWAGKPAKHLKVYVYPLNYTLDNVNVKNFQAIYERDVEITEPFSMLELQEVQLVNRYNTTEFEINKKAQYLMIEFTGTHDDDTLGATIAEVLIFT